MMKMLITGGSGFIGTNLVDALMEKNISILNLDVNPPKKHAHVRYWQECDVLDFDRTLNAFQQFQPTHMIHLAARTDTLSDKLDDYRVNTEGTINILRCIQMTASITRSMVTSSQFVFAPPGIPASDEEFNPIGAYGKSKAMAEQATRAAGLDCIWTITRPTNIWGPWHPRYPREFWYVLKKGLYFHPGGKSAIRSYGYVKNIVRQMLLIFDAEPALVNGRVYYLGDAPIPLFEWANGFSLAITGKPVKIIPRRMLQFIATVGSLLNSVGVRFPITRSRFRSMTEDYFSPVEITMKNFGAPLYSLEEGIKETVEWLKHDQKEIFS